MLIIRSEELKTTCLVPAICGCWTLTSAEAIQNWRPFVSQVLSTPNTLPVRLTRIFEIKAIMDMPLNKPILEMQKDKTLSSHCFPFHKCTLGLLSVPNCSR